MAESFRLPETFENRMREMLGDEFDAYLTCMGRDPFRGLRVNTARLSLEEFAKLSPVDLSRPVPWCPQGYYYDWEERPAKHPYYYAGLYYLQEPSAMTPAALLPIHPGDRVLDLCAAPGGKSTQAGSRLQGKGLLVSNDASASRAKALLKNIELFGIGNVVVTSEFSAPLAERFVHFFDKILIDAPCSGEGMFRKEESVIKAWERNGPDFYYKLQREIVRDAMTMLRPGGMILYSTCTFSVTEDERVVSELLHDFPGLSVIPVEGCEDWGFVRGLAEHPEIPYPNEQLKDTMRLYPHRMKGEGHYAALLQWNPEGTDAAGAANTTNAKNVFQEKERQNFCKKNPEFAEFLQKIDPSVLPAGTFELRDDKITLVPSELPELRGIHILRKGLFMGENKKNRFEPCQALAMVLSEKTFADTVSFPASDERVIRYLKGETITQEGGRIKGGDGWCLVCVDGFALGFAKRSKDQLKNKYFAPWRWQ